MFTFCDLSGILISSARRWTRTTAAIRAELQWPEEIQVTESAFTLNDAHLQQLLQTVHPLHSAKDLD